MRSPAPRPRCCSGRRHEQRQRHHGAALIRGIAIGILGGGLGLIFYGVSASRSFASDVSRFFTGNPTDHAMWLIICGVAMVIAGAAGLIVSHTKLRTAS